MKNIRKIIMSIILITLIFSTNTISYATDGPTASPTTPDITSDEPASAPPSLMPCVSPPPKKNTVPVASEQTYPTTSPNNIPPVTPIVTPDFSTPTTPLVSNPLDSPTPSAIPSSSPSTAPEITPNADFIIPTTLEIDTENIYDSMDKAYKSGYIPTIENEIVSIALPLISNNDLYENKITVTPDFSGTGSTFVISNYQKTINLSEQKINNSEEIKSVYFVTFNLPLSPSRVNGTYPLIIRVKALDNGGIPLETQFTVYITISDVPVVTPSPQSSGVSSPTAEPVILITDCIINPDRVLAGDQFSMKLNLKNSLSTKEIRNLLVSVDTGTLQINLEENGNVLQLDNIKANGSSELNLNFSSDRSIPAGKYVISFHFTYDTWQSLNISSTGTVIIEIKQPANMELVIPRIPEKTNSGETLPLALQVMNMGRDSMYNVRCEVSGIGLIPYNTGYIGTMTAGSSAETNVQLYVGTLTMSNEYTGEDMYGPTSGTIRLIYEDSSGEEYSQEFPFDTSIGTPIVFTDNLTGEMNEQKEAAASQWWISVSILFVIIISIVGVVWHRSRKCGRYEKTNC